MTKKQTLLFLTCLLCEKPLLGATRTFDEIQKEIAKKFVSELKKEPRLIKKNFKPNRNAYEKAEEYLDENYKKCLRLTKKLTFPNIDAFPIHGDYRYVYNLLHKVAYFSKRKNYDATIKKLK
ncbi:MAG: hypothetical protein AAF335_00990 [Bacteroidota bacterium]